MSILCEARVWHARHSRGSVSNRGNYEKRRWMIDFKLLRSDLSISKKELAEITKITGIARFRSVLAENGMLTFSPKRNPF
jgi:hypothetical protein